VALRTSTHKCFLTKKKVKNSPELSISSCMQIAATLRTISLFSHFYFLKFWAISTSLHPKRVLSSSSTGFGVTRKRKTQKCQ